MFRKLKYLIPMVHYTVFDEGRNRYLELWRQWLWLKWDKKKVQVVNRRVAANGRG